MNLISANVGQERTLQRKDRFEKTGIFKLPTDKPVKLTQPGLEGDVILSRKHHGGPDQAIYGYGVADYKWWSRELGKEISPGTLAKRHYTVISMHRSRSVPAGIWKKNYKSS
jgi:MOSC domain-containing protein YiiM